MSEAARNRLVISLTISLILIGIQTSLAQAVMYRDKHGRLHISDSLPSEGEYTLVESSRGGYTRIPSNQTSDAWAWLPVTLPGQAQKKSESQSPSAVFNKVNPSVWKVLAAKSGRHFEHRREMSQGSAVAISPTQLLTNCHVIKNRPYIVVKHGKTTADAQVISGDGPSDRCVLQVQDTTLTPISGYRTYSSLKVGEEVYTIGSPRGLENTLGEGIVSGLRKAKGRHLIQTTAQVSPGSSGGGLFDQAGNLVGVTTFILRDSDGINFAIAAEDFQQ